MPEKPTGMVARTYRTLSIHVLPNGDIDVPDQEDKFTIYELREILRELLEHLGVTTRRVQ